MRPIRLICTLSLLTLFCCSAFAQIPPVKVENRAGREISASSIVDGKTPAIISFWAVPCAPCIQELDAISESMEDWQQEVGFRVVAISTDDVRHIAKAKALTRGHMWDSFTLIFDPNSALKRAMNVVDTPQVFIIDKDGKIVYSHTGYTPGSEKELLKVLKTLK